MHNSRVTKTCGCIKLVLDYHKTPLGYEFLNDLMLYSSKLEVHGKVAQVRKSSETFGILDLEEMYAMNLVLQRVSPNKRQRAEWSVRALKCLFGPLHLPLLPDSYVQQRILELCCYLLNLYTNRVQKTNRNYILKQKQL